MRKATSSPRRAAWSAALAGLGASLILGWSMSAAGAQQLDESMTASFEWRNIGPAVFGGRIVDIELVPGRPYMVFAASASGGLFRSLNNGTTWECLFQDEGTTSIGDVAVDPKDPDTIWVGTGEANNQRSSYWGDGVYKTTDGGKTWTHTGLEETHHIGRVAIDPTDSDTVYVAAVGHLYTFNPERGLYKTTDGGKSWRKKLFVSEKVGVVDVAIDPKNPEVVYAASYERLRRAWNFDGAGPGSAIYKSIDGGENWEKLEDGLPSGDIGRIGLALYPADPRILYAAVSNQNLVEEKPDAKEGEADKGKGKPPRLGLKGEPAEGGVRVTAVTEGTAAATAGIKVSDVLKSVAGKSVENVFGLIKILGEKKAGDEIEIVLVRDSKELHVKVVLGERAAENAPRKRPVGGEVYRSEDGGKSWIKMNTERAVGGQPAYYYGQIRVDPRDDKRIYVLGIPVAMSEDGGKTWHKGNLAGSVHVDNHALAIGPDDSDRLVLGNDGGLAISYDRGKSWDHYGNLPIAQFYAVAVDMQEPYHVYGGTQDNGSWGGPSLSRNRRGIAEAEWYRVGGGDGFYAQVDPTDANTVYGESQFGGIFRLDKGDWSRNSIRPPRGDGEGEGQESPRFNWSSPILISHHNPKIIYFGGNRLYKSLDGGEHWPIVSEDLTTADPVKIAGNVPHCTITTIAESPIDPNLLLVGTDDGLVQLSDDGGLSWTNLAGRFPGAPANWWVSRVELSRHDVDTAYVSFTGYREDDFRPFIYRTKNRGKSWQAIASDLPEGPVNVVREDPVNPELLYAGTEFGAFASADAGLHWAELGEGMPTVAVHDLVVHPRDHDLVAATHGRGFFILDCSVLEQLSAGIPAEKAHLFDVKDVVMWRSISRFGSSGNRHYSGSNPARGAAIWYSLAGDVAEDAISLVIEDVRGKTFRTLEAAHEAGLHRVRWNLRGERPKQEGQDDQQAGGRRRPGRGTPMAGPGSYRVILKVGEKEFSTEFELRPDPVFE